MLFLINRQIILEYASSVLRHSDLVNLKFNNLYFINAKHTSLNLLS